MAAPVSSTIFEYKIGHREMRIFESKRHFRCHHWKLFRFVNPRKVAPSLFILSKLVLFSTAMQNRRCYAYIRFHRNYSCWMFSHINILAHIIVDLCSSFVKWIDFFSLSLSNSTHKFEFEYSKEERKKANFVIKRAQTVRQEPRERRLPKGNFQNSLDSSHEIRDLFRTLRSLTLTSTFVRRLTQKQKER